MQAMFIAEDSHFDSDMPSELNKIDFDEKQSTNDLSRRKESLWCLDEVRWKGLDPVKEHQRIKAKLDFPINPAFFKFSETDKR